MKILITGASGMLGRVLLTSFPQDVVVGTAFSRAKPPFHFLDLTNHALTRDFLMGLKPDILIHCAAERRPDVSDKNPDGTYNLNVEATKTLAETCNVTNTWMLYLSTEYVFDGTNPPYSPSDTTNPLNLYGKTKVLGEQVLREQSPDAGILRVGLLYGRVQFAGESAVSALLKEVKSSDPVSVDNWAPRYPTFVDDVAAVCKQIVDRRMMQGKFGGTWHWAGNEPLTKYEMASRMARVLGISEEHLRADPNPPSGAPRPKDCRLDCSSLEVLGIGRRTPFDTGIKETLASLDQLADTP